MKTSIPISTIKNIILSIAIVGVFLLSKKILSNEIAAIIAFTGFLLLILSSMEIKASIKLLIIASYILRVLYSFYFYKNSIIPFSDTIKYLEITELLLMKGNATLSNTTALLGSLHVGYQMFLYYTFKIFETEYSFYLINIFLFFCSIYFLFNHLRGKFDNKIAGKVVIFTVISMNLFIFTSHILKDSLVLFLSMLAIYLYDKYQESEKSKKIVFALLLFIAIIFNTITRIYAGAAFGLAILIDMVFLSKSKKSHRKKKNKIILLAIFIVASVVIGDFLNSYINISIRYLKSISIEDIIGIITYPISLLFSPFPWNMLGDFSVYTPTAIDSFILIMASPLLLITVIRIIKNKQYREKLYLYIIPILAHILALGSAYGTGAIRQRTAIFPYIILLFVLGSKKIYIDRNNKKI